MVADYLSSSSFVCDFIHLSTYCYPKHSSGYLKSQMAKNSTRGCKLNQTSKKDVYVYLEEVKMVVTSHGHTANVENRFSECSDERRSNSMS